MARLRSAVLVAVLAGRWCVSAGGGRGFVVHLAVSQQAERRLEDASQEKT
ncbi:MAG: hypothetical protein AB7S39_00875 [Gemmatimonadales bacterium]